MNKSNERVCGCGAVLTTRQGWKRHQYRCNIKKLKSSEVKLPLQLKQAPTVDTKAINKLCGMLKTLKNTNVTYNDNRTINVQKVFNDNRSIHLKTHVTNPSKHQIEPEDIISHMIEVCGSKEAAMREFTKYFELRGLKRFIADMYVPRMSNFRGYPWIKDKNGIGLTGRDALMPVICSQYSAANVKYLDMLFAQHCGNLLGAIDGTNRIVKATNSAKLADRWRDADVSEQYNQVVQEQGMLPESAPGNFSELMIKRVNKKCHDLSFLEE